MNCKNIIPVISFGIMLIGAIYISGCVSSSSHAVTLSFHDRFGNSLSGATVTSSSMQSTIFENAQSGSTDSSGNVVFSMVSTEKYNITVTYHGKQKTYQLYPAESYYSWMIQEFYINE